MSVEVSSLSTRVPAPVLPVRRGRVRDAATLMTWNVRAVVHAAAVATSPAARLWCWWLVVASVVLSPLLYLAAAVQLCPVTPWTFFFSDDRTACFSVRSAGRVTGQPAWILGDHLSVAPGRGHGHRLRTQCQDSLYRQADALGLPIRFTAASRRLAEHYAATTPDLERARRLHLPGRIPMIRRPRTPASR